MSKTFDRMQWNLVLNSLGKFRNSSNRKIFFSYPNKSRNKLLVPYLSRNLPYPTNAHIHLVYDVYM